MPNRLLAACLSLALVSCGTETPGPAREESTGLTPLGSTGDVRSALTALPSAEVLGTHEDGVPFMIRGDLGAASGPMAGLSAPEAYARVRTALAAIAPVFRLRAEDLVAGKVLRDELGQTHLRYAQTRNGLPVFGHELILHVDAADRVYAANGSARDGEAVPAPSRAKVALDAVRRAALQATPGGLRVEGEPRLLYARSTTDQRLRLAYEVVVTGERQGKPVQEHVFLDALDGSLVQRFSDIHEARYRKVYSATGTLPGTLVRVEGDPPTGDVIVDSAYDNLGIFYDCYKTLFNRDSYNNAGAQLVLTVHYNTNYVGAFWNGTQMVCGDGDGVTSDALCKDMDVVTHEFTHAVTSYTSNLTYSGESGGLNESLSDIGSAFCESWTTGTWSVGPDIWKIGEDIWTPGTAGDAIRYMDDPARDGTSLDYWTSSAGSVDVHYSSGISNLAFALLSKGGTHPRGKSTVNVTAIGAEKAARIFYRANTVYFTASTNFAGAKAATEQAARDLGYTTAEVGSVTAAWQAVGVGVAPACGSPTPLANGIALTGLSGAAGSESCAYTIAIPVGATNLKVELSGGTGDADLYVKFGSPPTTTSYTCRPYLGGNNETCTFASPSVGTYYVMLRGYVAYSGVSLKASFTPPAGVHLFPNLSGAAGSQQYFTYNAGAGQTVSVSITPNAGGSTGDADLYVKFGSAPTTASYNCRPYLSGSSEQCTLNNATAGTYYVMLRGYSAYTGVDLRVQ